MDHPKENNASPFIIEESDQQKLDSCSFDSACSLTPKDRIQMAAIAIAGIGIMSLVMYGFYWLAMKLV